MPPKVARPDHRRTLRISVFLLLAHLPLLVPAQEWEIDRLRVEYQENPLSVDAARPRFSWMLHSARQAQAQTAYQIFVGDDSAAVVLNEARCWTTGKIASAATTLLRYAGPTLHPGKRYYWKVRSWGLQGAQATSKPAWWQTGLGPLDWRAQWIQPVQALTSNLRYIPREWPETSKVLDGDQRAILLRKEFNASKKIARALLYITARGMYYCSINGTPVSAGYFAPGWTDYRTRLAYQTYEVTSAVRNGRNVIGVQLGHGWYAGTVAFYGIHMYGKTPSALVQLKIEYADNSSELVVSDESWLSAIGPICTNDMIHGEMYDARLEIPHWNDTGNVTPANWQQVARAEPYKGILVASNTPRIVEQRVITPVSVQKFGESVYVVDMGRNMTGFARLRVSGSRGQAVTMRFAEKYDTIMGLDTSNLLGARQTDTYILKGGGVELYQPLFTLHGFRYIEVAGIQNVTSRMIDGILMGADYTITRSLTTSDGLVNQLYDNIVTSFNSNFTYVPTDCPQRIERQGWMGDAGLFAQTATYMADLGAYLTKWMQDIRDAQFPDGAFSDVAPRQLPVEGAPVGGTGGGTNIWGDAGILIPWTLYLMYGDTAIIRSNYDAMKRWIDYCKRHSVALIRPAILYGDWLPPQLPNLVNAPLDAVNTLYFAYSSLLLSKMAAAIGEASDALTYRELYDQIKTAFNKTFISADGRCKRNLVDTAYFDSQTIYAIGLEAGLFPDSIRPKVIGHFINDIAKRSCLTTGIAGTKFLLPALSRYGYNRHAYALLQNENYPSWLHQVRSGATSIGESWESFSHAGVSSRNHVALGSVGEWMFRTMAGIQPDEASPGFKHILLRPVVGGSLTYLQATYQSLCGSIKSAWRKTRNAVVYEVTIPVNTTATISLPLGQHSRFKGGKQPGVQRFSRSKAGVVLVVASGNYQFTVTRPQPSIKP